RRSAWDVEWISARDSDGRLVAHKPARVRRPAPVETRTSSRRITPCRRLGAVDNASLLQDPTGGSRAEHGLASALATSDAKTDLRDDERHRYHGLQSRSPQQVWPRGERRLRRSSLDREERRGPARTRAGAD